MISILFNTLIFTTGKVILNLFGIKKKEEPVKDPLRVKTLDEIKSSPEITGYVDNFNSKAKRIGIIFYVIIIVLLIYFI